MSTLSERAVLVTLSTGVWSGRSHDREVTEEASKLYKADLKEAGSFTKQLISTKFINEVASVARSARAIHRLLTLPWMDNGTRIMSNAGFEHYSDQMRTSRLKFEAKVKEFIHTMPDAIKEAQVRLGKMYDPEDYPSNDDLKHKFSFDVEVNKVPEASDFRAKMSDATVKAIVKDIERRTEERVQGAMNDAFQRIIDVTTKMNETLKGYEPPKDGEKAKGNFQSSLITNVKEIADSLTALNITGDPRLEDLQAELVKELVEHSPEVLKDDGKLRHATAKKAAEIAKKVRSYLA